MDIQVGRDSAPRALSGHLNTIRTKIRDLPILGETGVRARDHLPDLAAQDTELGRDGRRKCKARIRLMKNG